MHRCLLGIDDPKAVYAPHFYSTAMEAGADYDPAAGWIEAYEAAVTACPRQYDVPVVVGEWGPLNNGLPNMGRSPVARPGRLTGVSRRPPRQQPTPSSSGTAQCPVSVCLRGRRLYDARATCLTYLASNGVPGHILARWAGHTDVATTKPRYVKPDAEDLREVATTWDGLHGDPTQVREKL